MNGNFALIPAPDFGTLQNIAAIVTKTQFSRLSVEQALYVMLKGFELGIAPLQALDGINIIQGKPTCSPQLMLALINRSGQLEDMEIEGDEKGYTVTMKRKGRSVHVETFSMADAKAMQLDGKDNWKKQPKTMLKWRAVAACARIVFPDVIQGLYTAEEMGADVQVSDEGDMVLVSKPEPEKPQIPATIAPSSNEPVTDGEPEPPSQPIAQEAAKTPHYGVTTGKSEPAKNWSVPQWHMFKGMLKKHLGSDSAVQQWIEDNAGTTFKPGEQSVEQTYAGLKFEAKEGAGK